MIDSSTTTPGTFVPDVRYVHDGQDIHIVLRLDLPEGTHIEPHEPDDPFLIPTVVTVNGLDEVAIGYPTPVKKDLGWNGVALDVLEGQLTFVVTGKARPDATVSGGLTYQPCIGGACLPPRTTVWSIPNPASVAA